MTICLMLLLFILNPIKAQANDNENKNALPCAGFSEFISDIDVFLIPPKRTVYEINNHNGFKSYMSYTTITDKNSKQYKLQQSCYTDENGFRKFNNRYCVAVGTNCNAQVGQYIDVELNNGEIISVIVADIKADEDTDETNTFTSQGCCLEFIIDNKQLDGTVKTMGDCSYLSTKNWQSPCIKFYVYDITILIN